MQSDPETSTWQMFSELVPFIPFLWLTLWSLDFTNYVLSYIKLPAFVINQSTSQFGYMAQMTAP
jgi:hypothetical protein